jgi:hypothetical protein
LSSPWTDSAYDVVVRTLIEMALVVMAVRASILTLQMPVRLRAALASS